MFDVRTLTAPDEIAAFFELATAAFDPNAPAQPAASNWQRSLLANPDYEPDFPQGAFLGEQLVGGCIAYHPRIRIDSITLPTTGLGAVCTSPDFRRRGVARAILTAMTELARERGDALLLLDGIPDFYGQFGYVDVVDNPDHAIERSAIPAPDSVACSVRPATLADAPALLALYRRHYGDRPGGFARGLALAEHQVRFTQPDRAPAVAVDSAGELRGYLQFSWERRVSRASEVVAEDWDAAIALLRWHSSFVDEQSGEGEPSRELFWPLPLDSQLCEMLGDRLPIRTEVRRQPNAGWMARPTSTRALLTAILPLLRDRAAGLDESAEVRFAVDGTEGEEPLGAIVSLAGARLADADRLDGALRFAAGGFTQVVFGFRSVERLARVTDDPLPSRQRRALNVLFPREPVFIAGSNAF